MKISAGLVPIALAALASTVIAAPTTAPSSEAPKVYSSATEAKPLKVGDRLPEGLEVMDSTSSTVNLTKATQGKTTLLIVYRGGWCPYCVTHLGNLGSIQDKLAAAKIQVLALSPDSPSTIAAFLEKKPTSYTLLSDSSHKAIKALGVAFQVDEATQAKLKGYKIDLEAASGNPEAVLPVPSVFVINDKGEITYQHSNPDYTKRLKADEVLKALGLEAAAAAAPEPATAM